MNIFLYEFKAHIKSMLIWTISMCLIMVLFLSFYPMFTKSLDDIMKLLENYPDYLKASLGITDKISTLLGFFSYIFVYIMLCGSIQAMNYGVSILSKENRMKTSDFLLTKPVCRKKVFYQKVLAIVSILVLTNILFTSITFTISKLNSYIFEISTFFIISFSLLLLQLIFMSIGLFFSMIFKKIKNVIAISLTTIFGFFLFGIFSSAINDEKIYYLCPFKYFDTTYILNNGHYNFKFLTTGITISIISIIASIIIYIKKDIHSV